MDVEALVAAFLQQNAAKAAAVTCSKAASTKLNAIKPRPQNVRKMIALLLTERVALGPALRHHHRACWTYDPFQVHHERDTATWLAPMQTGVTRALAVPSVAFAIMEFVHGTTQSLQAVVDLRRIHSLLASAITPQRLLSFVGITRPTEFMAHDPQKVRPWVRLAKRCGVWCDPVAVGVAAAAVPKAGVPVVWIVQWRTIRAFVIVDAHGKFLEARSMGTCRVLGDAPWGPVGALVGPGKTNAHVQLGDHTLTVIACGHRL